MWPVIERLAIETMDDHSVEKVVDCFWLKWHCLSLAIHPITGRLVNISMEASWDSMERH